jgi:hypothetical protein
MASDIKYEAEIASNALKNPQRVVFITPRTSANVRGDGGKRVMTYPHLILREAIVFQVVTIALVVLALFWDAPLEQTANPLVTPNPAKAPWYFLGLQELLHYFPPVVAGIIIPTLVVLALIVIPYFGVNIKGEPLWPAGSRSRFVVIAAVLLVMVAILGVFDAWTVIAPTMVVGIPALATYFLNNGSPAARFLKGRPASWWIMSWFITVAVTLTVVGTFFRGPGWSWVMPWR